MSDLTPNDAPADRLSPEKFAAWLREHPTAMNQLEGVVRRIELGEFGDLTPELRAAATRFVTARKQQRPVLAAQAKALEIRQLLHAPPGTFTAHERLTRASALFDELADRLLDVPEPQRTQIFNQLTPLRERLKALKRE